MSTSPPPIPAAPPLSAEVFAPITPPVQPLAASLLAQQPSQVAALAAKIDLRDNNSILFFGSKAQEQLTTISDRMLEGVRVKDAGPAGAALNEMISVLRGFNLEALDPNKKTGWFDRLLGKAKPLAKIVQQY
mgnify:FL=1